MGITAVGESQVFEYTGSIQEFVAPYSGLYQLEVWGCKGGATSTGICSNGGYSKGYAFLKKGETLFVGCGGIPYNGGGSPSGSDAGTIYQGSTAGGGATHIAKRTGTLSDLEDYKDDVIIVAGGAGGSVRQVYFAKDLAGGAGGGLSGGKGKSYNGTSLYDTGNGGSQSTGGAGDVEKSTGSFGKGGDGYGACGGGGGYYGGSGGTGYNSGGGGSGYIGGVPEISFKGNVYSPFTQNGVNNGTGTATITFLIKDLTAYLGSDALDAIYIGDTPLDAYIIGE